MELTIDKALQIGVIAHRKGELQKAERLYRAILRAQPNHPDANHNLGVLAVASGKLLEALPLYKQALDTNPSVEQFWLSYVYCLVKTKNFDIARQVIDDSKRFEIPQEIFASLESELRSLLENSQKSSKKAISGAHDLKQKEPNKDQIDRLLELFGANMLREAEALAILLTEEFPDHPIGWKVLGAVLKPTGRLDQSLIAMQRSVELSPEDAEAHNNLGVTLKSVGKLDAAEASYKRAITLQPEFAEAHNNLGNTRKELGKLDGAVVSYAKAIALKADYFDAHSNLLFLTGSMRFDAEKYYRYARDFARNVSKTVGSELAHPPRSSEKKRLRLGFVSGDLRSHPVAYFLEGLLAQLDSSSFELSAYVTFQGEDSVSRRLHGLFHSWRSLVGISNEESALIISRDSIDVLFDLSGHTAYNRLPIFAWRAAPIQVTWLGYFASTGLPQMDYLIGDPFVTPHEERQHFTEKLWQLPDTYFCFTPPNFDLSVSPLPVLRNGFITFGCFNDLSKMTDKVVAVRAKILGALPESKLFLKDKRLDDELGRASVISRFASHGISADRLMLEGKSSREEYLACYNRVDIGLSPFPYGGGTTSVEGLWMGVPVLSKKGRYFLSHIGESIAHNSGLSGWIAADDADYVAKAIAYASDLEELSVLRSGLREQVLNSPLFDASRFARNFERAVWGMWTALL